MDRLWTVARVRYGEFQRLQLELAVFAKPAELFKSEAMALTKFSHCPRLVTFSFVGCWSNVEIAVLKPNLL